MHGTATKIT